MINEKRARKYCKEDISKIKNYDKAIADTTQVWDCHHMTETWWNCTAKDLIENECYYHRKACELIFLTKAEHMRLHRKGENNPMYGRTGEKNPMYGRNHSDESRKRMSDAKKGKPSWNKGIHMSDKAKKKLSEVNKGKRKGMHWKVIDGKRVWLSKEEA